MRNHRLRNENERRIRRGAGGHWDAKAREEGYQCITCGAQIEYDDREVYIRTGGLRAGNCGTCAHKIEEND